MLFKAIAGAAIAGFTLIVTSDRPLPAPPPFTVAQRSENCRPFADLAAAAWEAWTSGTSAHAATILAMQNVSEPHIGRMITGAIRIGFGAGSAGDVRRRAEAECMADILGR